MINIFIDTNKLTSMRIGNASICYYEYSKKWGVSYCLILKDNEKLPFEYQAFETLQDAIQYAENQCVE